ncbi:MAG: thiamine pyrophosphate-dependent enzyme [Patescibacteria group bacterium]
MATTDKQKIAEEVIRLRLSQMIVNEEHKKGQFKIPLHLGMGHEAVAVAVSEIMEKGDNLLPTHRNIAYNLARTGALRPLLHEYLLKPTGLNKGRSGSMNLLNPERGIVYTSSILGNQFPVAVGLAKAGKMAGKNNVTIVMGGDGSIEEGTFYESMLMARSLNLPVIFIIENNDWSMSTRISERRCHIDLSLFAESLDIRYVHLDGNDPYFYTDALKDMRKFSVENSVPVCVEIKVVTLDKFLMKTPEHPEGEEIHPHMGAALGVSLDKGPIIHENADDPIFVLTKHIERPAFDEIARKQLALLQKEITL